MTKNISYFCFSILQNLYLIKYLIYYSYNNSDNSHYITKLHR